MPGSEQTTTPNTITKPSEQSGIAIRPQVSSELNRKLVLFPASIGNDRQTSHLIRPPISRNRGPGTFLERMASSISMTIDRNLENSWMPRFYYSHYHIKAAAFFARQSAQLEREHGHNDAPGSEILTQHRAYVTGCLFSVASFLEAQINEIFTDAADDQRDKIHKLGDRIYLFAEMWKVGIPRTASYSILEKYEIALALAEKEPLDHGSSSRSSI